MRIALSGVTDPDGDDVTLEITRVTQDEPVGRSRDAVLSSAGDEVRLRAERENRGDGRVYGSNSRRATTTEGAAPALRRSPYREEEQAAVDSAPPSYDSFG